MASPTAEPEAPKYSENEKILAHHQNLIYEAKVLKVELRADPASKSPSKKKPYYQIHYQGWNDRWDEWVDDSRILKYNDENKVIQQKMKEEHRKTKKKKIGSKDSTKIKKRKADGTTSPAGSDDKGEPTKVDITIPPVLKKKLVEDWESVMQEKNLVSIPRKPSVSTILHDYVLAKQNGQGSGGGLTAEHDEVAEGVKAYFDKALGSLLLYKFERLQYADILKNNPHTSMSELYGVEHLMRLFVKFPELIQNVAGEMEEETVHILSQGIKDILKYLAKTLGTLYMTEYHPAPPVYIRMATS